MKKRIVSLLLCAMMLMGSIAVFAGCTSGITSQVTESDAKAQTLVISIIKDERTTDEALAAVENALNEITRSDYNTNVVLKAYTAEEYAGKIIAQSESMAERQRAFENQYLDRWGNVSLPDDVKAGDKREYALDDNIEYQTAANKDLYYIDPIYHKPVTVYPTVSDDQLDIIFIDSLDLYLQLASNQYIISLENDFSDTATAKQFAMNTNETLLRHLRALGDGQDATNIGLYAIPNNYYIPGETYILVNKKLYDHYQYSIECNINGLKTDGSGCDDLGDFIDFMKDVAEGNEELKGSDLHVDKILYNFDDLTWFSCMLGDNGEKSAMMNARGLSFNTNSVLNPDRIYNNSLYKKTLNALYTFKSTYGSEAHIGPCFYRATAENNGYAAPAAKMEDNEEKFAVAVVTGDKSVQTYYDSDDYYVVRTATATAGNEMFQSMFAISTFSTTAMDSSGMIMRANIDEYSDQTNPRCLELLYALQSDKTIVNLLTYGVRNYNYDIYDNENTNLVHNAGKNGYYPIVGKAGNLFLTYPNDSMTEEELYLSANEWAVCYNQNCLVSLYCGLRLSNVEEEFNGEMYTAQKAQDELHEFYEKYADKLRRFDGKDDSGKECTLDEYLDAIDAELRSLTAYNYTKNAVIGKGFRYSPNVCNYRHFLLIYRGTNLDDLLDTGEEEDFE